MKNTKIYMNPGEIEDKFAYGYLKKPNGELIYRPLISQRLGGSGGIITTHEDFLKFDQNFYDNKLGGGEELIKKLIIPGNFNNGTSHRYAWGLFISNQFGFKTIAHSIISLYIIDLISTI